MTRVKRVLRASFSIPSFTVILLLGLVPNPQLSNAAGQEQGQPSPLRALQGWANQVPYQPIHSRIAIVDSGADSGMDPTGNLGRNIIAGWDSVHKTSADFSDVNPYKHGTHCAGIICGNTYSMVPSAPLLIVRYAQIDSKGDEVRTLTAGADGIIWAVDNGAQVITCPWHGPPSDTIAQAVSYAEDHQVIIVVASGNDALNVDNSPNCWELPNSNILRVAAITASGAFASNSNFGRRWVEIAAQGDDFLMLESTDTHFVWSVPGTSSAAMFAGTIAAMLRDSIPWDQVIPRLCGSVDLALDLTDKVWTGGLISPQRALIGDQNPPRDTVSFKGKTKKMNKKLSLSGTEVFVGQQSGQPILRISLQNSLLGFVMPEQDGSFSFLAKGRFRSGAEVRVQSSLGGEMTWSIP